MKKLNWKRFTKYTHAKLLSDTLLTVKSVGVNTKGRDVAEIVDSALTCLQVALIQRGQVCLHGIGTLVVEYDSEGLHFHFVPTPEFKKKILAALQPVD